MFRLRFMLLGITVLLTVLTACGCAQRNMTGTDQNCGPYPVHFRDIVMDHVFLTFPGDQVMRNIVVRPPSPGLLNLDGENVPGYVGRVRFSLKDEQHQTYRPVTYCFFLRGDTVAAFEDAREAKWCEMPDHE
jgi:hypothetical protein